MKKLNFNIIAAALAWALGHTFLYVYLNTLIPYATVSLFTGLLWFAVVFLFHYKWSSFMTNRLRNMLNQ